jgi:hypothetical protein
MQFCRVRIVALLKVLGFVLKMPLNERYLIGSRLDLWR